MGADEEAALRHLDQLIGKHPHPAVPRLALVEQQYLGPVRATN